MANRLAVLVCVAVFLAGVAVGGQSTKIRIQVHDLNDKPVDRASVVVKFVEGHDLMKLGKGKVVTWELKTNQEGIAKLPSMPQGKIRVQVIAPKYQTFGDVYDVTEEEKTISIKLNPPQQQYSAHE